MEVAVITRHAIANYGSLLQAAATQNALETLGHNCRIIDYVRPGEVCTQLHKCQLQQKPRWNRTPLRRRVYGTLLYTENVMAGRLFESARRQMLHLTAPYSTAQELTANGPKADVYMTGSDQVWGPMEDGTYDPVYRLTFAPEGAKKVAYAASFGSTELSKPLRGQFCRDLRQYATITVQEDSAIALLHQLGLEGKQVIDPVFLPDDAFWQSLLEPINAAPGSYFLVYQMHKDPALCAYAKAAAKAAGKPLLRLSASVHQATWGGKFIYAPTPGQFLHYIKNAACVITDSFHGTAFSLRFGVPFAEVLPTNCTGTCNHSLLTLTGLQSRLVTDPTDIALTATPINYAPVNKKIETARTASLSLLREMIEK